MMGRTMLFFRPLAACERPVFFAKFVLSSSREQRLWLGRKRCSRSFRLSHGGRIGNKKIKYGGPYALQVSCSVDRHSDVGTTNQRLRQGKERRSPRDGKVSGQEKKSAWSRSSSRSARAPLSPGAADSDFSKPFGL